MKSIFYVTQYTLFHFQFSDLRNYFKVGLFFVSFYSGNYHHKIFDTISKLKKFREEEIL